MSSLLKRIGYQQIVAGVTIIVTIATATFGPAARESYLKREYRNRRIEAERAIEERERKKKENWQLIKSMAYRQLYSLHLNKEEEEHSKRKIDEWVEKNYDEVRNS